MKSSKKALAFALAAAMVVTAVPVTNAEAASTAKLSATKATLYTGQSKTITLKTPSSWKSVKTPVVKTGKKSVATVKKVSTKKYTVKAVKAGTTKVYVKVTAKKNGKTVKKTLTSTITVKNPSLTVSAANEVAVGATEAIKATVKPAGTKVTYTSSDANIATVDEKGVVTGVKAGEVTITAKAGATTKTVKMTVKNYVISSISQTKLAEITATVLGTTKNIKASDITIKNSDNVVYPVKKVSVDSKDATKVTVETFSNMADGKEFTVTLDGTTKSFVSSDGKVASVGIDKVTIPYATETEIKLVSKDANGVEVDNVAYGKQDTSKYDFTLTTGNGYINGTKLYLNKVGDTATAEITYKTGKYGTDGKPEGNITSGKLTITAVDQAAVNAFAVKIGDDNKKFDKLAENTKVAVGDNNKYAYFQIKDSDGNEVAHYNDYTVESSDTSVLMLGTSDWANKKVAVIPAKEGTAYLLIKKDGKIVSSIAITVVAAKKISKMAVTPESASVTVSNSKSLGQTAKVTASFKDQYDADYGNLNDGTIAVTCLSTSASNVKASDVTAANGYFSQGSMNGNKVEVTFKGVRVDATGTTTAVTKGSYVYKIAYKDKDGKEVCARTVNVNVQEPGTAGASTVSFGFNMDKTSVDTVVDDNHKAQITVTGSVTELLNGVAAQTLKPGDYLDDKPVDITVTGANATRQIKSIYYTVTKDGATVFSNDPSNAKSDGKFNVNAEGALVVNALAFDNNNTAVKLTSGNYNVVATIVILPANTADSATKYVKSTIGGSFTVSDSQANGSVEIKADKVDRGTSVDAAVKSLIKYTYGDDTYDGTATIVKIEGTSNINGYTKISTGNMSSATLGEGSIVNVTKVVVKVKATTDVAPKYVEKEITTPFQVIAK